MTSDPTSGKVYLVGAGPGDPNMITLRGVECLKIADVVLYDYLVNDEILEHTSSHCELICLGRHGQGRIWGQSEINEEMIRRADCGQAVVRLKGGDPAIFARGGEEIEALANRGISFEVIPGITTALAAGSCAGIPVTHRDLASAVALVTGQEYVDKPISGVDYEALARFPGTLVIYMGVTTAENWTSGLIRAGKSPQTPTAIIRRCSFSDQTVIRCTLAEVVDRLQSPSHVRPPVIVIVGEVASLPSTFSWFEDRPLFGQRVLVTRAIGQVAKFRKMLVGNGADVIVQPAIQISVPPDWSEVDKGIEQLETFDWAVFSSSNGVRFFLDRLLETGHDLRKMGNIRLAAIGPGTTAALSDYHLRADAQPAKYRAESLADKLIDQARGRRFLLLRASRGREVLATQLKQAGARVTQVVVYESTDTVQPDPRVTDLLRQGQIDWVTVTSSAIARSLGGLFGEELRKAKIASISPLTSDTLRELGCEPTVEAQRYTISGVMEAMFSSLKDG